jgi:YggT family protein
MDFVIFVINFLFSAAYILLALRAVILWIPLNKMNPLVRIIYLLTEPFLSIIRMGLPPLRIGMDVSPFVMIILLWILQRVILKLLTLI